MKLLAEVSGEVGADPDVVFARLKEMLSGGRYPLRMEIDAQARTIAGQGGWWYRAEYSVEAVPDGSRVTHRVCNVAERGAWGVPLANRFFIGFKAKVAEYFGRMLEQLGEGGPGLAATGAERVP